MLYIQAHARDQRVPGIDRVGDQRPQGDGFLVVPGAVLGAGQQERPAGNTALRRRNRPAIAVWVSWHTLGRPAAGLAAHQYDIDLTPGTSIPAYTDALQRTLQRELAPNIVVGTEGASSFAGFLDTSLFQWLTVLVGVLAGLGVLNAALMATRERVHDLGVFKAVGMTPRQIITMVICWVIPRPSSPRPSRCPRGWPPRTTSCASSHPAPRCTAPRCPAASCTSWAAPTCCCSPWPG